MKIKNDILMMGITTSLSDEIGAECTTMDNMNDDESSSFYDSIKHSLDLQLLEPSPNSVDFILNYSRGKK